MEVVYKIECGADYRHSVYASFMQDCVHIGMGYDTSDSFVDDSEQVGKYTVYAELLI